MDYALSYLQNDNNGKLIINYNENFINERRIMGILEIIGLILLVIIAVPTALLIGSILLIAGLYIMIIIYALIMQVVKEIKALFNH